MTPTGVEHNFSMQQFFTNTFVIYYFLVFLCRPHAESGVKTTGEAGKEFLWRCGTPNMMSKNSIIPSLRDYVINYLTPPTYIRHFI